MVKLCWLLVKELTDLAAQLDPLVNHRCPGFDLVHLLVRSSDLTSRQSAPFVSFDPHASASNGKS